MVKAPAWVHFSVAMALSAGAGAQESVRVALNIEPQPIRAALKDFGQQTGLQVLLKIEEVSTEGVQAPAVEGQLSAKEALEKLLAKTDLTYEFVNARTIRISEKAETGPVAKKDTKSEGTEPRPLALAQANAREQEAVANARATEGQVATGVGDGKLPEVLVTGTHIRGQQNTGSELIVLDQEYFQSTGFSTLEDVLRTLPQATAGPNQSSPVAGVKSGTQYKNWGLGTGINLRGLGAGSTLVLVDGMRQASSGTGGTFVDISSIPLTAVERIDVLLDGASATYGSDAVGGVVNIILKKRFNGFETKVNFGTLSGDSEELRATQLAGKSWEGGSLFGGIEYYERDVLLATDRRYSANSDQRPNGGDNFSITTSFPGNILCMKFDGSCEFFAPVFSIPSGQDGTSL